MRTTEMWWPEVFTNPEYCYIGSEDEVRGQAIADGLTGWANCVMERPPDNFGLGMVRIGNVLNCTPLKGRFRALAKKRARRARSLFWRIFRPLRAWSRRRKFRVAHNPEKTQ